MNEMRPASISCRAGPLPLKGTCIMRAPVMFDSISAVRWADPPMPDEPKVSLSGLALAAATSSCMVL